MLSRRRLSRAGLQNRGSPHRQVPMTPPKSSLAAVPAPDFSDEGTMPAMPRTQHDRMANAIRALAMDAVEQAKSGHPGLPMGAADVATVLFTQFLKFDPADPDWPDRDRFVLSAGHGSMLLYALLYLLGYEAMTIDEIKRFRQLGSLTPGHPENVTRRASRPPPVRSARASRNAVGMAIAEAHLAATFGGHRRSPHLCARLRRRPDGRHQPGGDRACRAPQAQQADRAVRRQRHLDRRPAVARRLGRPGEALRGRRLERRAASTGTIPRRSPPPSSRRKTSDRPIDDRLPHHHRLRRADQGRQGDVARLAARRRRDRGRAREARLDARRRSRCRPTCASSGAPPASAARPAHAAWTQRLQALAADKRAEFERRIARRAAGRELAAAVRR